MSRNAKQPVIVLGSGGNAIDSIETIESTYEIIGFVDDDVTRQTLTFDGKSVHSRSLLETHKDARVITLIGSESTFRKRETIISSFEVADCRFATIIHPSARVSRLATIGHDVIIFPGVTITANATVGNHVFILPHTVIHHDVTIGDYTIIGSNVVIAGNVTVGKKCYLGSGSSVKHCIEIGDGSMIGMAANVVRNVPPGSTMIGNPARTRR